MGCLPKQKTMEILEGSLTTEIDDCLTLSLWLEQKGKELRSWGPKGCLG